MGEVDQDVTVKDYFEDVVPKLFAEQMGGTAILGMDGTEAKLTFKVDGTAYSMVVKDAKELGVVPGAVDGPLVVVELSEPVWREAVTGKLGGAVEMFTDMGQMANRSRFDKLSQLNGTLVLDLSRPEGDNVNIKVSFNGAEKPQATFRCAVDDWVKMSRGEVSGMTAFMGGQLKIEGDMQFALELSSLVS